MKVDLDVYAELPVTMPVPVEVSDDDHFLAAIKDGNLEDGFAHFVGAAEGIARAEGFVAPPRAFVLCAKNPLTGEKEERLWTLRVVQPEKIFAGVDLFFLFRAAVRMVATAGEALAVAVCAHTLRYWDAGDRPPQHSVLLSLELPSGYMCRAVTASACDEHGCHYGDAEVPTPELAAMLSGMLAPLPTVALAEPDTAALTWSMFSGRPAGRA